MGNFSLIYATGTLNYSPNPSFEIDTKGWINLATSIERTDEKQTRGAYSLKINHSASSFDGTQFTGTTLPEGLITVSADLWLPAGIPYLFGGLDISGNSFSTQTITGTGDWQRYSYSYVQTGTAASDRKKVSILKGSSASVLPAYIDGLQIEHGPLTTYADGDSEDCYWNGARHSSTSTRPNTSSLGGIEKDLEDEYGLKIIQQNGIGMPVINNISSQLATQPGAFYQGYTVPERVLSFVAVFSADSPEDLHSKRQAFINAVKPGKQYILKYKLPTRNVLLKVTYEGGLEFGRPIGNNERVALRFVAYEPYWYEEYQQGSSLTPQQTISNANKLIQRDKDGNWQALDTGVFGGSTRHIKAFARGLDNTLYFGGAFETSPASNDNNFGYYRDGEVTVLTTFLTPTAVVNTLCTLPNGKIFLGGVFSSIGGVSNTSRLAVFNPETNTFESLATGTTSSDVNAAVIDRDGNLIVGGFFTTINGQSIPKLAKCVIATKTWSSIGNPSGTVRTLELGPDGNIYIGVDEVGVMRYDGSTLTTIGPIAVGQFIYGLEFDANGILYIGGQHTGTIGNWLTTYNGNIFATVGNPGVNNTVTSVKYNPARNTIIAAGDFSTADNLTLPDTLVEFNGSSFVFLDVNLPGTPSPIEVDISPNGEMTIGFNTTGDAVTSAVTELENRSTAPTYPTFEFFVSGTATATALYQIRNEDTGQTIYLNMTIQPGETIIVNLEKKTITSSYRGNVITKIIKGSNFASWALTTSNPRISMFANQASLAAKVYWTVRHFSADGSS